MKAFVQTAVVSLSIFAMGCGDTAGPSEADLTPSVVSLEFTGDSMQSNFEVTVSWTLCPEDEFNSYVLYRSETAGIEADPSQAEVLGVFTDRNTAEYTDSETSWNTEYFYVLKTTDEGDGCVWSNEDSITTPQAGFPEPSVLSAQSSIGSVLLSWTESPDQNFSSYRLYRSETPNIEADTTGTLCVYSSTSASDTIFVDSDVTGGSDYYYALLTLNAAGLPGWSNEEAVTVPESLSTVQSLQLLSSSSGRTVCLAWDAVAGDIEGYAVYFKEHETAEWLLEQQVTTNSAQIIADCAGYYSVKAYCGEVYSENYSNSVSTMPSIIQVTYTIYDNFCPADTPSGFIFGPESGQTGFAPNSSFLQDIYVYDDSKNVNPIGDLDVSFYSGSYGPFGNGNQSNFQPPQSGGYGYCEPNGSWSTTSYVLHTSDSVVFVQMPYVSGKFAYAKVCSLAVAPNPESANGTQVSFTYEYQPEDLGLTLFTNSR